MDKAKRIAILTGATGGLGHAFLKELCKENIDEIWSIGRNSERLSELVKEFGNIVTPFCMDLTELSNMNKLSEALQAQNSQIDFLINNAGIAQMKQSKDLSFAEIENTINLNCKAPVMLTNICLPYMKRGSKIINVCSASAFQPTPYINLYASTKAFERSYSRALNVELRPYGISVTAACPSWIDTGMLTKEINGKRVRFSGMVSPERVARSAVKDAKKGKDMSVCSLYVKCQHVNVKLMPQRLTMKIWTNAVKKYGEKL